MIPTVRLRPRPAAAASGPCIVLVEPDPYLAYLLRLEFPTAEVVEPPLGDADPLSSQADLVIVDLDAPRTSDLLAGPRRARVLAVGDGRRASETAVVHHVDDLLLRPFSPQELARSVRRALGIPEAAAPIGSSRLEGVSGWIARGRVAAVLLAGLLELLGGAGRVPRPTVLVPVMAYVLVRMLGQRTGKIAAIGDLLVATVAVGVTGGFTSYYIGLAVLAALQAGVVLGTGLGVLAALTPAMAPAPAVLALVQGGGLEIGSLFGWVALFPLASLTGALLGRLSRSDGRAGPALLAEANRVLSALFRIARTIPQGFDLQAVAAGALEELRESLKSPGGALLLREAGVVTVVGCFGLPQAKGLALRHDQLSESLFHGEARVVASDALGPQLSARFAEYPRWFCAPLRRGGLVLGLLLAASPEHGNRSETRSLVEQLADETAVAVENSRLFSRLRELSADEERRRLARELHDGVAQDLTHVRLELELLARRAGPGEEGVRDEAARLARVVGRALGDVRSTIQGLRAALPGTGLPGMLGSYLRDLQGLAGPAIELEVTGAVDLPPDVESEIFRVAQEAVSNAIRHARASRVVLSLSSTADRLVLGVEDDGIGLPLPEGRPRGVGLEAMRERAVAIGARLSITPGPVGGTRVELDLKVGAGAPIEQLLKEMRSA
ncbi:MAG: sensor histidine kinase [Actinomycetota bacterium]